MGYTLESPRVLDEMIALGVHMYPNTTAKQWNGEVLEITRSDTGGALPSIAAAHLIAVGAREPQDALLSELQEMEELSSKVSGVGDCIAPGIIQAAVFSGHAEARRLIGDVPQTGIFKRETPVLFS